MTESPKYNYRIDFRPLDTFFFGGEVTFGNGNELNYFARSRPYPQQTTILGVLRHLGYLDDNISPSCIGTSFSADPDSTQGKYGFIEAISPLFFHCRGINSGQYLLGPMLRGAQSKGAPSPAGGTTKRWMDGEFKPLFELPEMDPKEWYTQPLLSSGENNMAFDDLVKKDVRIGITKQRDGAERTDGFYKQEVGMLHTASYFSAYLTLQESGKHLIGRHVLPIGGEKAQFIVEIEKLDQKKTFDEVFPKALFKDCISPYLHCAVLLCDAYIPAGELEKLPFVVADTVDFRYLSTPRKVTDFGRLSRSDKDKKKYSDQIKISKKFNLLARGSLLYAEEEQTLRGLLDQPLWQTVGYNHYHLLLKTSDSNA